MSWDGERHGARAEARVGQRFAGKFRLHRLLGVGGSAAVYEATHRNGKRVALKVMSSRSMESERRCKRFLREAYVANRIDHPGVVQIHDDGVDQDGAIFLVMELLQGETLAALRQRRGGQLELATVLHVADQVLDVLAAAHDCGVIHRDIKPENVFLEANGRIKVLDFGVARLFEHVPGSTVDTQDTVLGTPAFMPPEQALGHWHRIDPRSDIWAVGAMLFTLVSGELVHGPGTPNEQLGRAMSSSVRSLATVAPELPPGFVVVVDRALRYAPDERWDDARAMQLALRQLCGTADLASVYSVQPFATPSSVAPGAPGAATKTSSWLASLPPAARTRLPRAGRAALMLLAPAVTAVIGLSWPEPRGALAGSVSFRSGQRAPGVAETAARRSRRAIAEATGSIQTGLAGAALPSPARAPRSEASGSPLAANPRKRLRPASGSSAAVPPSPTTLPSAPPENAVGAEASEPAFLDRRF